MRTWEGSNYDPEPVELTEWAHCLYETPEGEIVMCAECAENSGREDVEVIDQADDNAPCIICHRSFADLRRALYERDRRDEPGPDDIPF